MASNYSILYSPSAYEELEEIYEYISRNFKAPETAREQIKRITQAIRTLAVFPKLFRVRKKDSKGREVRLLPIDNYVIIYSVDDANYIVNILHVLYGRRNMNYFFSLD